MDGDDKEPEDATTDPAPGAAQEEGAKLREVSEDELKQILADHQRWVETRGKEGEEEGRQADLIGAKLQGADLGGANLTKAKNLTREQLDKACGDDETKLPDDLADYQMKACPTPEQPPSN